MFTPWLRLVCGLHDLSSLVNIGLPFVRLQIATTQNVIGIAAKGRLCILFGSRVIARTFRLSRKAADIESACTTHGMQRLLPKPSLDVSVRVSSLHGTFYP
jgi:hypothetical protein